MNFENLVQRLADIGDKRIEFSLNRLLSPMFRRMRSATLTSAGLVIKTGGSTLAKTGAGVTYYQADGTTHRIAASTDMPALSGTVTNGTINIFVFLADSSGTVTSHMGTAGTTLPKVKWPKTPTNKAILGFVVINPTGTGSFVGGTTALDDATVVPNAAYVSPIGAFDPNAKPI